VVYAYESLVGEGTLGALLKSEYESRYQSPIILVPFGSAGEALNRVRTENKVNPSNGRADVVLGLDSTDSGVDDESIWEPIEDGLKVNIPAALNFSRYCLPFDHSYLAILYHHKMWKNKPPLKSLTELVSRSDLKKSLVIQDPRTSSIGFSLLLWARSALGPEKSTEFWKGLTPTLVSVSPGWSSGYGMFLKNESAMVSSYLTSVAYHRENESGSDIDAFIFPEGHYHQIECAAVLKTSPRKEAAMNFLKLLVDPKIQSQLPKLQWMFPVLSTVKLPDSFKNLPSVKPLSLMATTAEKKAWLNEWKRNVR